MSLWVHNIVQCFFQVTIWGLCEAAAPDTRWCEDVNCRQMFLDGWSEAKHLLVFCFRWDEFGSPGVSVYFLPFRSPWDCIWRLSQRTVSSLKKYGLMPRCHGFRWDWSQFLEVSSKLHLGRFIVGPQCPWQCKLKSCSYKFLKDLVACHNQNWAEPDFLQRNGFRGRVLYPFKNFQSYAASWSYSSLLVCEDVHSLTDPELALLLLGKGEKMHHFESLLSLAFV